MIVLVIGNLESGNLGERFDLDVNVNVNVVAFSTLFACLSNCNNVMHIL